MKVLLDESVPRRLASAFPESFGTRAVQQMGWAGYLNGELLRLFERLRGHASVAGNPPVPVTY